MRPHLTLGKGEKDGWKQAEVKEKGKTRGHREKKSHTTSDKLCSQPLNSIWDLSLESGRAGGNGGCRALEPAAGSQSACAGGGPGLRKGAPRGSPHQQHCSPTVASENPEVTLCRNEGCSSAHHTPDSGLLANLLGSLSAGLGLSQRILARTWRTISSLRRSEVPPTLSPLPGGGVRPQAPIFKRRRGLNEGPG